MPFDVLGSNKYRSAGEFADARLGARHRPSQREILVWAEPGEEFLNKERNVFEVTTLFGIHPQFVLIRLGSEFPLKPQIACAIQVRFILQRTVFSLFVKAVFIKVRQYLFEALQTTLTPDALFFVELADDFAEQRIVVRHNFFSRMTGATTCLPLCFCGARG